MTAYLRVRVVYSNRCVICKKQTPVTMIVNANSMPGINLDLLFIVREDWIEVA